ncbi:MAG: glycosyltransferase family 39 protein [Thermoleophilia bacterium]|nr:glycosyltransferase family 39 protein [Thermoleophilia bacterium]
MNEDRSFTYILLPSIIIGGAILRFAYLGRESLWYDELFTVWAGSLPLRDLIAEGTASGHPLLYNLATFFWLSFGSGDVWIRMISLISGVIAICFMYFLGKEYVSRRVGLWAAALAAVSPFMYYYSREATDKAMSIAAASASLYLLVRSMNRGGWGNWTAYILATAAVLFAHFYGVFLVAGAVLFYFAAYGPGHVRFRAWLTSQLGLAMVVILWFFSNRGSTRWIDLNMPGPYAVLEDTFYKGPVALMGFILPLNHGDVFLPGTRYIFYCALAVGVLILSGLMLYSKDFRGKILDRKVLALALLVFIVVAGPVLGQIVRDTYTSVRYFAWAIVPFLLLAAVLIAAVPRRAGTVIGAIAIAGSLAVTGWSMNTYEYDNWRGIMSAISEEQQPDDRLLCFPFSECSMAAHHYLKNGPVFSGGYINDSESVQFYPPGVIWAGYDTSRKYGSPKVHSGERLRERILDDINGAERVWIIGGSGSVERIKRADAVYGILEPDWRVERETSYPPYLLRLYVHNS